MMRVQLLLVSLLLPLSAYSAPCPTAQTFRRAHCSFQEGVVGSGDLRGTLIFRQSTLTGTPLTITGQITGITPDGEHGMHIHESGEIVTSCADARGHFNPFGVNHGGPTSAVRHVGDLGNFDVTSGVMNVAVSDTIPSLFGTNTVIGRAIVVHSGRDDLGLGDNPESLVTGNAGSRLGCCRITAGTPP